MRRTTNPKGYNVSETTTTASNTATAASRRAAAAAAEKVAPAVVETVEVAMEVPAKVVLNQKLVIAASVVVGAGLGAGVLYGITRWRNRNKVLVSVPDHVEEAAKTGEH